MSATVSNGRPRRLTQPERSAATRQALLDATIECLIEQGYDRCTTGEISERAGLSRGAHLHHFQTRATLLASAAQEVAERGGVELRRAVERLPEGAGRTAAALDMVWGFFRGELFQAVLELSIHARSDPELRAHLDPVERLAGRRSLPLLRRAFGREPGDHGLDDDIAMVLATVRGLALLAVLEPGYDPTRRWRRCRARLLGMLEQADGADAVRSIDAARDRTRTRRPRRVAAR